MKAVHRHSLGHEHEFEPQYGLPEVLPASEKILWQGSPETRALAFEVFHLRKLAVYFALVLLARAAFVVAEGGGAGAVVRSWAWLGPMAVLAMGLLLLLARLVARTTVYTLTDRRVVMRIGIVLTVTFNLPYTRIAAAGVRLRGRDGHGDIALTLARGERIAILQLWPHARPWRVARPEPMLRALPQAESVGRLLCAAWNEATAQGRALRENAPAAPRAEARQPAATEPAGAGVTLAGGHAG